MKKTKKQNPIGLLGEHPQNDSEAIQHLLKRHVPKEQFKILLKNVRGSQLDSKKTKRILEKELLTNPCKFVVFIRDLDGLESETDKIKEKQQWFAEFKHYKNDLFLLNIYELEALILADITTFNQLYNCQIKFTSNPMFKTDPKAFLKTKTYHLSKKYHESHASEIFKHLNIQTLIEKCAYFKTFITHFDDN